MEYCPPRFAFLMRNFSSRSVSMGYTRTRFSRVVCRKDGENLIFKTIDYERRRFSPAVRRKHGKELIFMGGNFEQILNLKNPLADKIWDKFIFYDVIFCSEKITSQKPLIVHSLLLN